MAELCLPVHQSTMIPYYPVSPAGIAMISTTWGDKMSPTIQTRCGLYSDGQGAEEEGVHLPALNMMKCRQISRGKAGAQSWTCIRARSVRWSQESVLEAKGMNIFILIFKGQLLSSTYKVWRCRIVLRFTPSIHFMFWHCLFVLFSPSHPYSLSHTLQKLAFWVGL